MPLDTRKEHALLSFQARTGGIIYGGQRAGEEGTEEMQVTACPVEGHTSLKVGSLPKIPCLALNHRNRKPQLFCTVPHTCNEIVSHGNRRCLQRSKFGVERANLLWLMQRDRDY